VFTVTRPKTILIQLVVYIVTAKRVKGITLI